MQHMFSRVATYSFLFGIFTLWSNLSFAGTTIWNPNPEIVKYRQCFMKAAHDFHVPVLVLEAIADVEHGRTGLVKVNKNGTKDYGIMQINSQWIPVFGRYIPGIKGEHLARNSCLNIWLSAFILKNEIRRAKGNIWLAVGRYHSPTRWRQRNYVYKVATAYVIRGGRFSLASR
ncbi:MAG: hypothetical protein D6732_18150 [Methanobacteriota archaeon]|nr:MAG: hypothetical protein D6732_18150 [Euryarchaeota archaeon]